MAKIRSLVLAVLVGIVAGCAATVPAQSDVPRMSREELKARLGAPELIVVDVRSSADWMGSDRKIAGAVRENPWELERWAGKYSREKTLVLYCS